jgi:hypothetical protein
VAAWKVIRLSAEAEALRPDVEVPEGKTAIPCEATDSRLSAKAVGILVVLYSRGTGASTSISDLLAYGRSGRDALLSGLKELADTGWIEPLYVKARIPPALRMAVLRRDGYRCVVCDTDEDLMADHVIPESLGGPTTFDNLQTMCRTCNSHKGAKAAMPE